MIDPTTFRLIAGGVVLALLGAVVAGTALEVTGHDSTHAWATAGAALTGLMGLLVNPRTMTDPSTDPGAAAVSGYREAITDVASLAPAGTPRRRRATGDKGRAGLVEVGVFLVLLAAAYLIWREARGY